MIADEEIGYDVTSLTPLTLPNPSPSFFPLPVPPLSPFPGGGGGNGFNAALHRLQQRRWSARGPRNYRLVVVARVGVRIL